MKKKLLGGEVACAVRYGELSSIAGFGCIPNVGEYEHWNVRQVVPVQIQDGKCFDLRDEKEMKLQKNCQIWPLVKGTVLHYPDGQDMLLTKMCSGAMGLIDVTNQPLPQTVTHRTVRL